MYFDDIKRNASSRQIIPLQGVTDDGTMASGSITVEVGPFLMWFIFTCFLVLINEHVQNQLKKSWSLEQFRTLGR